MGNSSSRIKNGDSIIAEIVPMNKPLCLEDSENFPILGRFSLLDMRAVVGIGNVISVKFKQNSVEQR